MELTIEKKVLLKGLGRAKGAADTKGSLPILSHTVISVDQGLVQVQATDLYVGVSTTSTADSSTDGKATADAKKLYDMVRALPEGPVKVAQAKGFFTLQAGKTKFRLPTLNAEEFPPLPQVPADVPEVLVEASILSEVLALTQHAVSQNEVQAHLAGVLVDINGGILTAVATDGHKLAKATRRLEDDSACFTQANFFVPKRGLEEIKRLADSVRGEMVGLVWTDRKLFVCAGDTTLSVGLGDNKFPAYERVIPSKASTSAIVNRAQALEALHRIALVGEDLVCTFEDGLLHLNVNQAAGTGVDEIGTTHSGPALSIGFGAGLLITLLEVLDTETVAIELTTAKEPAVVRAPGFLGVAMPRRI